MVIFNEWLTTELREVSWKNLNSYFHQLWFILWKIISFAQQVYFLFGVPLYTSSFPSNMLSNCSLSRSKPSINYLLSIFSTPYATSLFLSTPNSHSLSHSFPILSLPNRFSISLTTSHMKYSSLCSHWISFQVHPWLSSDSISSSMPHFSIFIVLWSSPPSSQSLFALLFPTFR